MKSLLSRFSLLGAMVVVGCASLPAQDPEYRNVAYSEEELDNLVAPVALYPDALLAHILVAATFPDQVALASRYVRERGTRNIENQGWDISVKAVAYYPPVLNMLASDEDWSIALGQAYANQSGDVMDAVQRLREMAREQGNLVSTREHTVSEDRGRIIIVPANPQVIYVPTYDPAIVYVRPIWSFGFHTGYFSFGIGFPIGSWLVYEPDWWGSYGHRVYYHGWYGDGWRYYARRHFTIYPVYHRPRYSIVNININIFNRYPNYYNLDRRHRYVRRTVAFERHDRGGRNGDRDRYGDRDDRRGSYDGPVGRDGDSRNGDDRRGPGGRDGNDRIGDRVATFDDFRPDRGGTGSDARDAEPPVTRSGFTSIDRQKRNGSTNGATRSGNGGAEARGSRPDVPVFTSQPRSTERKSNGNGNGNTRSPETRSAPRPNAPVFSAPERSAERSPERKSKGNGGSQSSEFRSAPRSNAPVYTAPQRSVERKSSGGSRPQSSEFRSAPRANAPVYSAPQRSVERKSSGGGGGAQMNRPTTRSAPSVSRPSGSSGGGGGGGKVKQSGGGGGGGSPRAAGGKGRKQ
jgi:hypothetical protein